MTDRRGSVFLWIAYAIVFFICYFFAAGIFGRFALMGSVPDIIPVAQDLTWPPRAGWRICTTRASST